MPDSSGNGEREYINQHGYLFQYVLGHAFIKQDGAIGYKRKKDDPTQALVRLFDAPPWDHQATIDAEIPLDHLRGCLIEFISYSYAPTAGLEGDC